jgi:hypothetical protein
LENKIQEMLRKTAEGRRQLEESMGIKYRSIQNGSYCKKWIVCCSNDNCMLYAHNIRVASDNFILKHPEFKGLTCFEIAHHHPLTNGLWACNLLHKQFLKEQLMHNEPDCNDDDTGSQNSEATEPPCKKKKPANP